MEALKALWKRGHATVREIDVAGVERSETPVPRANVRGLAPLHPSHPPKSAQYGLPSLS
jgi:hypothetical protein